MLNIFQRKKQLPDSGVPASAGSMPVGVVGAAGGAVVGGAVAPGMGAGMVQNAAAMAPDGQAGLAMLALNNIHEGVIMTDATGVICFINSAAVVLTGCGQAANVLGLDWGLVLRLADKEGAELAPEQNPLIASMQNGQIYHSRDYMMISRDGEKRIPISVHVLLPTGSTDRLITFRDITEELKEEGEQAEFISTASHEMRTPVASIEGFLGLALNEQTATIDDRAREYLTKAHDASVHLGQLFRDLLDVTKLDDGRLRPNLIPINVTAMVRDLVESYDAAFREKNLVYSFGPDGLREDKRIDQLVFGFLDQLFLQEIMTNLIENAIKYTPEGGSVWVNVRGDGDRMLINVTDSGIGISQEDLSHIFQKFYRADNSETRTSSGTGLGLYLVKQRVEAMGGKVWAESSFGDGSTFYISLPRISDEEYQKRVLAMQNSPIQNVTQNQDFPAAGT